MRSAPIYEEEEVVGDGAELSLGMGTLLGIFFGLALVCGVFFGFGYMMGHRSPGPYVSSEPLYEAPKPAPALVAPKPSAQIPEQSRDNSRVVLPNSPQVATSSAPASEMKQLEETTSAPTASPDPKPQLAGRVVPGPANAALPAMGGNIMVQIAAVKSRPDAEALADALRKNGFSPTIRNEAQDKLLHVQIGPFDNREEAKGMRQRLSNAGYNAFIK